MTDLSGYAHYRFPDGRQTGNEWMTQCPMPDCVHDNDRYFINLDSGRSMCHHCQFKTASWVSMIMKVEGLHTRLEVAKWINEHKSELKGSMLSGSANYKVRTAMDVKLPDGCSPVESGDLFHAYLVKRGFGLFTIEEYGVLKCESGWYRNRIIIPIYEEGKLVFFFDRSILDTSELKTSGIGSKDHYWPVDKSSVVFNIDSMYAAHNGITRITEGVFDAMSLGSRAIALLGKSCSTEQMHKIMKRNPGQLEVCLDNDALKSSVELATRFHKEGAEVFVRRFTLGDPNDYLRNGWIFPERVSFQKFNIMYKMGSIR